MIQKQPDVLEFTKTLTPIGQDHLMCIVDDFATAKGELSIEELEKIESFISDYIHYFQNHSESRKRLREGK